MKHHFVLIGLFILTLIAAALAPSLLDWLQDATDSPAAVIDNERPVEVAIPVAADIPLVAYEDAVGDPLLPEPMSLAAAARQQSATAKRRTPVVTADSPLSGEETLSSVQKAVDSASAAVESEAMTDQGSTLAVLLTPTQSVVVAETSRPQPTPDVISLNTLENLNNSPKTAATVTKQWYINAAVFSGQALAQQLADRLRAQDFSPEISEQVTNGKTFYRVMLGPYQHRHEAGEVGRRLVEQVGIAGTILQI